MRGRGVGKPKSAVAPATARQQFAGYGQTVILAYSGRRMQALGGDPRVIDQRIRRQLADLAPTAIVGAAADGADIMVVEAALALPVGPVVHVVLPTTREIFREDSVEPAWRHRFDALLDAVEERGGTIRTLDLEPTEDAYRRANKVILDRAAEIADADQRVTLLVVAAPGQGQMIEDILRLAELSDVPALRIDPSA